MAKFIVKVGHRLTYGKDVQSMRDYREGEAVDMSDDDAKRYGEVIEPWTEDAHKVAEDRDKKAQEDAKRMGLTGGGIDPLFTAPTPTPTSEQQRAAQQQQAGGEGKETGWLGRKKHE